MDALQQLMAWAMGTPEPPEPVEGVTGRYRHTWTAQFDPFWVGFKWSYELIPQSDGTVNTLFHVHQANQAQADRFIAMVHNAFGTEHDDGFATDLS